MVTIALILVSVCFPRNVHAAIMQKALNTMKQGLAEMIYDAEIGVLTVVNNIFCDDGHQIDKDEGKDTLYLMPETIIKGHFLLMNANIFSDSYGKADESYYYDSGAKNGFKDTGDSTADDIKDQLNSDKTAIAQGKVDLQQVIRGWYTALRNFAIVALLSVLVYIGIRMMLTSVAQDKARYKMMLKDWLVAMCLVALMHFIMVATLGLANMITHAVGAEGQNGAQIQEIMERIEADLNWGTDDDEKSAQRREAFGLELTLLAIIVITVVFAVKYVKRAVLISFLVLLAPITAITYPLDKISDGKAQAFNFWFREFFYNVIIQPFHLLLYIVLIGAAATLANTSIIYTIVCYAMMFPAERLIREMFGFRNKLGAPLGAMATAAGVGSLVKSMSRLREGGSGSGKGGNSGGSNGGNEAPPPIKDKTEGNLTDYDDGIDALPGDGAANNEEDTSTRENNTNTDDGIDYERANAFRGYREQGMTQEEAEARVNEELPLERNNTENEDTGETSQSDNGGQAVVDSNAQPRLENDTQQEETNTPEKPKAMKQIWRAKSANHDKRLREKYGTSNSLLRDGAGGAKQGWQNNTGRKKITGAIGGFIKGSKLLDPHHKTVGGQRFKRVAGRIGKTALRTGMIGAGALAGATLATVTGDPKKIITAASAGAALGNTGAKTITGVAGRVADSAKSYYTTGYDAVKGQDGRKERAKQAYINNQQERDYAAQRLYEKSGGIVASRDEIDEEMEKRYRIRENGITDNGQIDAILDQSEGKYEAGMEEAKNSDSRIAEVADKLDNKNKQQYDSKYKKHYDELTQQQESINSNQNLSDTEKEERLQKAREKFDNEYGSGAAEKALAHHDVATQIEERSIKQSLNAHKIASQYSESAFRDEKKMTALRESSVNEYRESMKQQGREVSVEHATDIVVQAMSDAAEIKGVKGAAITNPYRQNSANNRRNTRNNTNNNNNTSNQNLPQNSNEPSN